MEENVNTNEKKTFRKTIKDNKKVIIVGGVCLAVGVTIGIFGPKVVRYLINAGAAAATVAEPVLEAGAEVAIEAATAVV